MCSTSKQFIHDSVNNHGHTLDDIVRMVVGDTDVNGDGFVSYEEFQRELLGQFDVDG